MEMIGDQMPEKRMLMIRPLDHDRSFEKQMLIMSRKEQLIMARNKSGLN